MIRRILVILALAGLGIFVGPVSPACACSCTEMTPAESLADAELVFVGVVAKIDKPLILSNSGAPVTVTLSVSEVYKGAVTERVKVTTASDGAACGYDFVAGRSYVVLASNYEGSITTSLCSGNRDLANESNPYGGGTVPLPGGPSDRWPGATPLLAGTAVVALILVAALWFWRRRRIRPAHAAP
jgi:hypothetical protein